MAGGGRTSPLGSTHEKPIQAGEIARPNQSLAMGPTEGPGQLGDKSNSTWVLGPCALESPLELKLQLSSVDRPRSWSLPLEENGPVDVALGADQ